MTFARSVPAIAGIAMTIAMTVSTAASASATETPVPVDRPTTVQGVVLPADADRNVDQAEYVARGLYWTNDGMPAPLPKDEASEKAARDAAGIPSMKLHGQP